MVLVYNMRTVKNMDPEIETQIKAAGVPIETYKEGYTDLGPVSYTHLTLPTNREV